VKEHASGEERLASVAPITTGRADLIFLTHDASTQSSRIFRYVSGETKEVYSFNSQKIVAFQ